MSDSIEWPKQLPSARRRSRKLLYVIAALAVILFGGRSLISYWVDWLWFGSLGYGRVFLRTLALQWGIFAAFAAVTFACLYGVFSLLKRAHIDDLPVDRTIIVGGQQVTMPIKRFLNAIVAVIAVILSLLAGAAMTAQWPTLALYWFSRSSGKSATDPIFGKPLEFYLFTLPAWNILSGWLLALAILTCLAALAFLLASGGARAFGERLALPLPWRGVSGALTFLYLALALRSYLGRFSQLTEHHTIFEGVAYTGAHVTLTGALVICAALVLGALIAASNTVTRPRGTRLIVSVVPVAVCYLLVAVVAWYVNNFVVKPNELAREQPYIEHNIEMTRQAYGLDRFDIREFPAETTVEATDPANNQATLQNIRLWDWHALEDTLRQIQEIRTYYDFPDIDIDRYQYGYGGSTHEVMLAARELNVDKLPESSRNWINEKLVYTHGYGITMNPVNGFTPEGLPTLIMSNMPIQSTVPNLKVTRPEIYFGELTNTDVYVKTGQKEFNYPQGEANNLTTYEGSGGISMGGFWRHRSWSR